MKLFHFTLGPVQSFVAQARRTRDLWAGSFLLSWLSGQAMKAVLDQGGKIIFPRVTDANGTPVDPMLKAIMGIDGAPTPQIGSIPNRFKAEVPDDFDAGKVAGAVTEKWKRLANAVFDSFVQPVAGKGNEAQGIWKRQIDHFWEINWVLGDRPENRGDDDIWLDLRKNWRSHWPEPEGGDHCTLMADYQELSGYVRAKNAAEQDDFWAALRQHAPDDYLDIRDAERLCAIALIKRLFPRLGNEKLKQTIGWTPGDNDRAIANWPSTTYMAVAPWLAHIQSKPDYITELDNYARVAKDNIGNFAKRVSEQATYLATLGTLNDTHLCGHERWKLSDLDGDLLHIHALRNHRSTYLSPSPLTTNGEDADPEIRKTLVEKLARLYRAVDKTPRSYYALLLMDGDKLGDLLRREEQSPVSAALLDFTRAVEPCVNDDPEHGGVTIYAGGDDVFALLPMNTAIVCALALRRKFGECFAEHGIAATASCAIVFAHHQAPLRQVIREAHHQLDDIAKEKNGRDSLALAVYTPGGVTAQWVGKWDLSPTPVERMQELVGAMQQAEYPRGFFHKMRDRYGLGNASQAVPDAVDMKKLLQAEYMQTRDPAPPPDEAERAIERLLAVCQPEEGGPINIDGGFIARFLTREED